MWRVERRQRNDALLRLRVSSRLTSACGWPWRCSRSGRCRCTRRHPPRPPAGAAARSPRSVVLRVEIGPLPARDRFKGTRGARRRASIGSPGPPGGRPGLATTRSSHGHPRNHIRISPMDNPHRLLLHREVARCYAMGECVPACRGRPAYRRARSACAPVAGRPRGGTRTADKPSLAVEEWSRGRRARAHQFRAEISSRYWDAPAGRGRDPVPQCWYEQY